jgi:UDP-2,4-diacetamido-2,4,6-trideoxy-beta-L-altropyranose hydrolase
LNSQTLLVRADASTAIGSGHVMRCFALAKAWQSAGGRVSFFTVENIPNLEQRFAREGIEQHRFAMEPGSSEDAERTADCAHRLGAAWVVVDGYRFGPDYIHRLKGFGLRVLHLDDDARLDFYEADIALNQNPDASSEMYVKREASTRLLLGADYVLLRPEFLAAPRQRQVEGVAHKILVTMGGSDPENVTLKVLDALAGMAKTDFEAKIVVGGGNPHYALLQDATQKLAGKAHLEESPSNMAPLMTWADIAISAAGGTCWELAFMGVPMILIVLTSDQSPNASAISCQGGALSLGWHANLSPRQIGDSLKSLMDGPERRREMSELGRKLVDGEGAARVVACMQNSLNCL